MTDGTKEPCPFCGEASQDMLRVEHMDGTIRHPAYRVICENCGAATNFSDRGDHIKAWNTRSPIRAAMVTLNKQRDGTHGNDPRFTGPMLQRVDDARVFAIRWNGLGATVRMEEGCDEYFAIDLTAKDLLDLAAELVAVAGVLPEPPK